LPQSLAAEGELARLAEVTDSLQSGILYPRWASYFHFGYGSPLFNYLAPAPHYLGGLHLLMTQSTPAVSLRFMMVACIIIAGVGMFTLGRKLGGDWGGFIAMMLYLLSPTIIYRLAYIEVNLGLLMAAALFPWALWSAMMTLQQGTGRDSALCAFLGAALLLTSNWMGLGLFLGMIAWGLWVWQWQLGAAWRSFALALGVSLGLSAFYWLPVLLEWEAVRWSPHEALLQPLQLGQVLDFPSPPDFSQLNPTPNTELGPAIWGLSLAGLVICALESRQSTRLPLILLNLPLGLAALVLVVLATQLQDDWLDDAAKFPSLLRADLLIPAAAGAALMGGQVARALTEYVAHRGLRSGGLALLGLLILASAYQTLNPPPFRPYRSTATLTSYMQSELRGAFAASLTTGLLLPADVQTLPSPSFALVESFMDGEVIKLERASRLPNTNLGILSHSAAHDSFRISNEAPTSLEILTFNFWGWNATFRERPAAINSALGSGLIMVTVPAGDGTLEVRFQNTRARSLALLISLVSFVGLLALLRLLPRQAVSNESVWEAWATPFSPLLSLSLIGLWGITLLIARGNVASQSALTQVTPHPHVFEGGVDLLGFQLRDARAYPGQLVALTLYWEAARPNLSTYWVQVHLVNSRTQGRVLTISRRAPGGWLTSYWNQEQYVRDDYYVPLPSILEAGRYDIQVEVLQCENSQEPYSCPNPLPVNAYDPRGTLVGKLVTLPQSMSIE
jgi:hypothetical protein